MCYFVYLCVHLAHICCWHYPNSHPFQSHNEVSVMGTEIPFLARRWKHLSNWPLSRDELTLWQVGFVFSSVSPVLLLSMSRIYLTPPDFWIFMKTLSYPARRLVCSLSGFTTQTCFANRCSQCWSVSHCGNLSTNLTYCLLCPVYCAQQTSWNPIDESSRAASTLAKSLVHTC